ncbi:TRM11 family SAM-dependent methyltransferase [Paraferrimonas sedimenticola]|uniref:DNA methylase n=1 Tax=Paraferrimonas sedimenticola TaxID=375674 RepID=A0AA37RYH6_9GAMM|nr:DNA methylase [Paraferrimonas sedimenticola]GLP97082.1 DNA methylase [Paraferrimonas sedimenticola]
MPRYVMLANPGHNRIYFESSQLIAQSELKALAHAHSVELEFEEDTVDGLPPHLCFMATQPLSDEQAQALAASSMFYALFEVKQGDLLAPMAVQPGFTFPESMVQILRYTGKTNEQFTRMMVNLAIAASNTGSERPTLLDPMCGKGTSLYEGLIRGFNVNGVEINSKWVEETRAYLLNFMKKGRYKHKGHKERRNISGSKKAASVFVLDCAHSKEAFKQPQKLQLFDGDTRLSMHMVKKRSCDMLVTDLPYGVQHGAKQAADTKLERSPERLLADSLPAWKQLLKSGASLVISFNEFTLKWQTAAECLKAEGFEVLEEPPFVGYSHRVDQSIKRDLIVARKP